MAPSKLRRAIGAVKDKTSIGLAIVGNSSSLSDLDVPIVKATSHEEFPAEERYIREILSLTCYSRARISACVSTLARRLNKTKNWTVALKTLMLIQRLLAEGDPAYEQEIFFATRRGTRILNMCDFRDASKSNSWDYSAFVRTYALYLDERLEYRMLGRRGKRSMFGFDELEEPQQLEAELAEAESEAVLVANSNSQAIVRATPTREMNLEKLFSKMQHFQQLLERFLACRPTGAAKNNRVVFVALYPIVKESFQLYYDMMEIMGVLVDRFVDLEVPDCVKVYEIFTRVGKQLEELELFYGWCKDAGVARSSEYPEIEKITQKKLDLMDEFIRDKSVLGRKLLIENKAAEETKEEKPEEDQVINEEEEPDMNSIKALPPPEGFAEPEEPREDDNEEPKPENNNNNNLQLAVQVEADDLLNLGTENAVTAEEHADKLALALFDGVLGPASAPSGSIWQAFSEEDTSQDWETTLIQSATKLSTHQTASLPGGFDMLLLDGMYQQGTANAVAKANMDSYNNGSASSVAVGSAGRPSAMLALPAPPAGPGAAAQTTTATVADPFAASLVVPPPAYVQMSDMEKKQTYMMEEQRMWQQYSRDGKQEQMGMAKLQQNQPNFNNINMGGYTRSYRSIN